MAIEKMVKLIGDRFVYDGSTGLMLYAGDAVIEALRETLQLPWASRKIDSPEDLEAARKTVSQRMSGGAFRERPFTGYRLPTNEQVRSPEIRMMTLVVTEACNLRCSYCPYSCTTPSLYRKHGSAKMSVETADAAVDYFVRHAGGRSAVAFFGGEPLLNFGLIKRVTGRVKEAMPQADVLFTLTTNLNYLTDEILRFLVDNKFLLTVSLDGPQHLHDRFRRMVDGRGSFGPLMANLNRIKERYPGYFANHVTSNTVIVSHQELSQIDRFFSELNPRFCSSQFSSACEANPDFYPSIGVNASEEYDLVTRWVLDRLRNCAGPEDLRSSVLVETYLREKALSLARPSVADKDGSMPFKTCIPGYKPLINTDGSISICEKLETLKIGHVRTGLDFSRSQELIGEWQELIEGHCAGCWAVGFCRACYIVAWDGTKLNRHQFEAYCEAFRRQTMQWLEVYLPLRRQYKEYFEDLLQSEAPIKP